MFASLLIAKLLIIQELILTENGYWVPISHYSYSANRYYYIAIQSNPPNECSSIASDAIFELLLAHEEETKKARKKLAYISKYVIPE